MILEAVLRSVAREARPPETAFLRFSAMSNLETLYEKLIPLLSKGEGGVSSLDTSEKESVFQLFCLIEKELKKNPADIPDYDSLSIEIRKYLASRNLFLYAQTYIAIVQSVTAHQIGWIDMELNNHYQNVIGTINRLLSSEECKDFPGDFDPINDNIFPESGILDIGWHEFADSCVDFLSRTQKFCIDTPLPQGDSTFIEAYVEWLKSRHLLIIKKAEEYNKKAKQLWRKYEEEHFGKKEIPDNAIENKEDIEDPETRNNNFKDKLTNANDIGKNVEIFKKKLNEVEGKGLNTSLRIIKRILSELVKKIHNKRDLAEKLGYISGLEMTGTFKAAIKALRDTGIIGEDKFTNELSLLRYHDEIKCATDNE